jgi:hypothetical protein
MGGETLLMNRLVLGFCLIFVAICMNYLFLAIEQGKLEDRQRMELALVQGAVAFAIMFCYTPRKD